MRTPTDYKKHLEKNEITEKMISDCAYSMNKRAKNMRDNQRTYRDRREYGFHDYYHNEWDYKVKKEYYYSLKNILLSPFKPICIHSAITESPYGLKQGLYLFTEVGGRTFHQLLETGEEEKYTDLEIISIGRLTTYGADTNDLISVQFTKKVVELIKSGQYTIVEDD